MVVLRHEDYRHGPKNLSLKGSNNFVGFTLVTYNMALHNNNCEGYALLFYYRTLKFHVRSFVFFMVL